MTFNFPSKAILEQERGNFRTTRITWYFSLQVSSYSRECTVQNGMAEWQAENGIGSIEHRQTE